MPANPKDSPGSQASLMAQLFLTSSDEWGAFCMTPAGPFVAGTRATIRFTYRAGTRGLPDRSRLRIGLPNTGWEKPVVPQQRYWNEIVHGLDRRLAPFHPVNTTASIRSARQSGHSLDVMERMLVPDEDPALAYWRWWIDLILEDGELEPGGQIEVVYGDCRFGSDGARVQTFAEKSINVTAYLNPGGQQDFYALESTPVFFDVISGDAARANVVVPSVQSEDCWTARISLTDECQCIPNSNDRRTLLVQGIPIACEPGRASVVRAEAGADAHAVRAVTEDGRTWGTANPTIASGSGPWMLFWGDLHAQSEHHVMHSQVKDFRQEGWSKGISCGTLDECYHYGREVSLLDFVAITDQGACLTSRWEYCQQKVREHHLPGTFVVFKGYEAGSAVGHRNVIYLSDEIEPPFSAEVLGGFHPHKVFDYYRGRTDVLIIPHHVKTWTDWSFHDPILEPVMEIYSCWGQSESPGLDLWGKGQTPGAGAWEAFRRGYRLGMMASSDNHVGMPGRSYPGDRQAQTPFKAGLCAIWAAELSRESLFEALRSRRCYGTTGSRIIVRFLIGGEPMGSILVVNQANLDLEIEVHGTEALERIELVHDLKVSLVLRPEREEASIHHRSVIPGAQRGLYYLRIYQKDGERAWTSPIWIESH
jgi:hypothetical protein